MEHLTDEQLIEVFTQGEQEALEILIQRYLKPIYNFVFKYMHTVADTEDVTQEAFVKIWKNIHRFNPGQAFKPWAYTIAKNTALDALKKKGWQPFSGMESDASGYSFAENLLDYAPLPEQAMQTIDSAAMVNRAISTLPEHSQSIIDLYYKGDLNFREIGLRLQQSVNTVKTRHRRAIAQLKKELPKE